MDQAFSASAKELAFIHGELDRAFADVLALLDQGADDSQLAPALHGALGVTAPDLQSRLAVLRGRLAEHCRDEELLLSPENLAILVSVGELRELAQRIEARFAASAP